MTKQDSFEFGTALARNTDPDTSHDAAESLEGEKASHMEGLVLAALLDAGSRGATNHDLVAKTGLPWNTVSPRIRPLANKGYVIDSGERRPGPSGKRCIVWKAKAATVS